MKNSYDLIDTETPVQTVEGPHGLVLHLDAGQMYPDDPGMGTPCLFERKNTRFGSGYRHETTMTWTCGYEGGNINELFSEGEEDEEQECRDWIEDFLVEDQSEWERIHWEIAEQKLAEKKAATK